MLKKAYSYKRNRRKTMPTPCRPYEIKSFLQNAEHFEIRIDGFVLPAYVPAAVADPPAGTTTEASPFRTRSHHPHHKETFAKTPSK
jgi:hypothetical protein